MAQKNARYSANNFREENSERSSEVAARDPSPSKAGRGDKDDRRSHYKASTFHKRNDRALLTWSNLQCYVAPVGKGKGGAKK